MAMVKSLLLILLASTTVHSAREEDDEKYSFTNLHEYIERNVQESIQRALTESDEKHVAQIALLREENERRIQQVKDELSKKHANDMVSMRNEFETHIRDLNMRLETVVRIVENQLKSADVDGPISDHMEAPEISPDETFDNINRPLDKMDMSSEEPIPSHRANGRNGKLASSQIDGRNSRIVLDEGNALKRTSRQVTGETRVAFFAAMIAHNTHLGDNHDLVFDEVHTNIGNAYNNHHGTFIAPVDGVYVFSCTLANSGAQTIGRFMVNGSSMARFRLDSATNWQGSQTIIVTLRKGQDVSVQNSGSVDASIYGHSYSTFSGFLLYEDFSSTPAIVG